MDEEWTEAIRDALREEIGVEVSRVAPGTLSLPIKGSSEPFYIRLHNLWDLVRDAAEGKGAAEAQTRFVCEMGQAYRQLGNPTDLSFELLRPMLWQTAAATRHRLASQSFAPDVDVVYAVEQGERLSYLTNARVAEYGLTLDEIHDQAVNNILGYSVEFELMKKNSAALQVVDSQTASRWLIRDTYTKARALVGDRFILGLPTRDEAWIFPLEERAFAEETVEALYYSRPYPVTKELFVADGQDISVLPVGQPGWFSFLKW